MNNIIKKYAKLGEQHDVMDALILLTKAYISMCGISLGFRTVVYYAAESWLEKLAWMDQPLSEMARKKPLVCVMPYITSEYDPEYYDEYDITGMEDKELLSCCKQIIREKTFDETTNEVLCWGLLKATEEEKYLSLEIEATAPDGTLLKGILEKQERESTRITMISPYENLWISKYELVRDAKELLLAGYADYQRLHSMEDEIRALYPKYLEELKMRENESSWSKLCTFHNIYDPLIGETVLATPQKLLKEWFGLNIFNWNE